MKATLALALLLPCGGAAAQACTPYWTRVGDMHDGAIFQLVPFDDGTGERLYLAGGVSAPSFQQSSWVVRWDGHAFDSPNAGLPPNLDPTGIHQLRILDHGSGPELWLVGTVGNQNRTFVRRWDGSTWRDERPYLFLRGPTGIPTYLTYTLTVTASFDSGHGPEDYGQALGLPDMPTETTVVRWTGTAWEPVGHVRTENAGLAGWDTFDDGSGPGLYVMGEFYEVNGVPLDDLARWDGTQWSQLGGGVDVRQPRDMCVYDDGKGEALYVADIIEADGHPMDHVAKWDGKQWTSIGDFGPSGSFLEIYSMATFNDGSGEALYVAGLFLSVAGQFTRNLAKWDGHEWTPVLPGVGVIRCMASFDDPRGPSLFLGGYDFNTAGGGRVDGLVQYVGCPNCYADCNRDGALTLADFGCFQTKYALQDPYANCNLDLNPGSLTNGLSLADYMCFQTKFAAGCP